MIIPLWAKILGPIAALAIIIGGLAAWGSHKYHSGYGDGVQATDQKWVAAGEQLKKDAAKSANKADDAAANRVENFVRDQAKEQEKIDEAQRKGGSPFDVLFGSDGR